MKKNFIGIILLLIGCSSTNTPRPSKTVLEKYMDFNTSYYTVTEYKDKYQNYLNSQEEILGLLTIDNLNLLSKNKRITKKHYYRYKKIILQKMYKDIKKAIQDKYFTAHITKKDKTAKLSLVVYNNNKAIIQYAGGDEACIWSTQYLVVVKGKRLHIYEIDGFSAMYDPVHK